VCAFGVVVGCGAKSGLLVPDPSPTLPTPTPGGSPSGTSTDTLPDFSFLVPYESPPSPSGRVIGLATTTIKQVDVAFSVDTTGSMNPSIKSLESTLTETVLPDLEKSIPNVGFAVVDHKDSDAGDPWTVMVRQTITPDVTIAQEAVASMTSAGGSDEPEAQEEAMLYTLTGEAIDSLPPVAAHTSAPGTFGAVDFRPGALPIVVEITDAHWHDAATLPWAPGSHDTVTLPALADAFTHAHARFVAVTDMHTPSGYPFPLLTQPNQLSDATGSSVPVDAFHGECGEGMCCTGAAGAAMTPDGPGGTCRLNFQIENGVGMTESLVRAIAAISVGTEVDIVAAAENDDTNALGADGKPVDATKFIGALRAMDEGDVANGCVAHEAKDTDGDGVKDTFVDVVVGTHVCFEVVPKTNDSVEPKAYAQTFYAFVDILGLPGKITLDRRRIEFIVPARAAA
jgi:hypothetical protein